MMIRRRAWQHTKFGRFVRQRTVVGLAEDFHDCGVPITTQAIYGWLYGRRHPTYATAEVLILDVARGTLNLDDLRRHRDVMARVRSARIDENEIA